MISLTMPYYRRQAEWNRSLTAYDFLYSDMDIEISICDDGSPECLQRNVETEIPVLLCRLPEKHHALNPCVPFNRAVEQSRGDIIVLTNPEIVHKEPILEEMVKRLKSEDDYVIAACWNKNKMGKEYWVCHSTAHQFTGGRQQMPSGSGFHFCTMLHRSLWEKAGGFDEDYREGQGCDDNDWLWRLEDVGANFVMCDDLVVYHHSTALRWPREGLTRNRRMLKEKWGHKWS